MVFQKLSGLIAASHTPFKADGSIAYDLIQRQAELSIAQGVTGVYISGTTGEGVSCSVAERKQVMTEWVKAAKGKLFIIAHIGALALPDTRELAAYAAEVGVDATSIVPPNFLKPGSVDQLLAYLNQALEPAKALPFYYYHTTMSGVNLSMTDFLEAAQEKLPNLAGIKFNNPDLYAFQNCRFACGGKYDITFGVDEFYAGALALGCTSAIGSTYNYMAPHYIQIEKDLKAGRFEAVVDGMHKVCQVVDILVQYGGIAAGKVMMQAHGLDLGDVRLPVRSLNAAEKKDILSRLDKLGVIRR